MTQNNGGSVVQNLPSSADSLWESHLFVNTDRKEYIDSDQLRGSPVLTPRLGIEDPDLSAPFNLAAALLLGRAPRTAAAPSRPDPLVGSWAGERTAMVPMFSGEAHLHLLPEDVRALIALGAAPVEDAYEYFRDNFQDVSGKALQALRGYGFHQRRWVREALARPEDGAWITPRNLPRMLDRAAGIGNRFFERFVRWLAARPGVSPKVRDYLARCSYRTDLCPVRDAGKRFWKASRTAPAGAPRKP